MEGCRRSMADSWWACYAASAVLTSAYPLLYVPAASFMTKRKRSINKHLLDRTATLPSNYWFVVVRSLAMLALSIGWQLRYMASHAHVHWGAEQATLANTLGAYIGCAPNGVCLNFIFLPIRLVPATSGPNPRWRYSLRHGGSPRTLTNGVLYIPQVHPRARVPQLLGASRQPQQAALQVGPRGPPSHPRVPRRVRRAVRGPA